MEYPRFHIMEGSKREAANDPPVGTMKEYMVRLREIFPHLSEEELADFKTAKALFKELSPEKRLHVRNVSLRLARMLPDAEVVLAAFLHDAKEQTPKSFRALESQLPGSVVRLVHILTEDKRFLNEDLHNEPLAQMKAILPTLEPEVKRHTILIKCADRLDNLERRLRDGDIPKTYRKKSRDLIAYLASEWRDLGIADQGSFQQVQEDLAQLLVTPKKQKRKKQKVA